MISGRLRWVCVYLFSLTLTLTSGCRVDKPPQEVAQCFWEAMKVQDIENGRGYATTSTRILIDPSNEQFKDAAVTFGKIIIDGDLATIDTTVRLPKHGTETTLPIQTILKKEDGEWRVDYAETKKTIMEDDSFSEIAKNLQELGGKLSERMDEALGEIKQKFPEYKEKMEKMGEVASKKMDEALQRYVAEIKKGIEKLGGILDEVLQKEGGNDKQEATEGDGKP
ncbi:MAG: hypothetical protein E3K40_01240 [Candidatus Brocadia sp.]|nr:hypothetical protein [Candidatus Brocadia sp.]MDG6025338.1 hypothetical protein [Candidatus Brocadia sp.]